MMSHDQQHLLLLTRGPQAGPQQRGPAQIKRAQGFVAQPGVQRRGSVCTARRASVEPGQCNRDVGFEMLTRRAFEIDEARAQDGMTLDQRIQRQFERRCIQRSNDAHRVGDVVDARCAEQVLDHPQRLLRERTGRRVGRGVIRQACMGGWREGGGDCRVWCFGGFGRWQGRLRRHDCRCQLGNARVMKQRDRRHGQAPIAVHPRNNAGAGERIASDGKEVVVSPQSCTLQHLAEHGFQRAFDGVGRRLEFTYKRIDQALMQADALHLASRRSGQRGEKDDLRGHLERRQAFKQELPQFHFRNLGSGTSHNRGGKVFAEGGVRDAEGDRLRHFGVLQERLVHFPRGNLFATSIDQFLQPTGNEEPPRRVEPTEITGAEPVTAKRL